MKIRQVKLEDAEKLLTIYAPYIKETAITFETEVPSLKEFQERIQQIQEKFPYLVAEVDGEILGYAYAHTYYGRAAYDWTVEVSIYVDRSRQHAGIGSKLYDTLETELTKQNLINFLACISLPNEPSIRFHEKRGYKQVAHFHKIGFKLGQWHDIIWMQKRMKDDVFSEY